MMLQVKTIAKLPSDKKISIYANQYTIYFLHAVLCPVAPFTNMV